MSIFSKSPEKGMKDDTIYIVSGIPRSGTSMMMRILEAGGLSIVTDHVRKPDEDNPRGYYEFEKVKNIVEDASWLKDCRGKAFKMVSALLYFLPRDMRYKLIFMKRNLDEVLSSQSAMLKRLGQGGGDLPDTEMAERFKKHLQEIEEWMAKQPHLMVKYMSYNDVINNPLENAEAISRFIGNGLNIYRMAGAVEKALYRQRR